MAIRHTKSGVGRWALITPLTIGVLSAGLLVGISAPASASPPLDLDGAYILDEVGVLASERTQVEAALDRLFDERNATLVVVVVDRFDGSLNGTDWADQSAGLSGLGDGNALLAIAVDDREYATSVGMAFPATDVELAAAELELAAELRDDQWAAGIIAYADSLSNAQEPVNGVNDSVGDVPIMTILLGVIGLGLGIYMMTRAFRRKSPVTAPAAQQSMAELDQTASRRLVQVDDALRTSEQELGFADAQFGTNATEEFRQSLTSARELVAEAFRWRRQLDDETPETDDQKRTALTSIIAACDKADALLDAQQEAFAALRDVENDLAGALARAVSEREAAPATIEAAESVVTRLQGEYAASAIASVTDAPTQARRLLALIDAELAEAQQNSEAGKTSEAALDVHSAQRALRQLADVSANVHTLADELAAARAALAAQQDDTRAGIAAASALDGSPALTEAITAAQEALNSASADDPLAELERVVSADRALDAQLADARDEAERRAKAHASLERTLASAEARIRAATEYITAHRGGVGATARSRLAEAQAQLAVARAGQTGDPSAALESAQRALDYAGQAMQAAEGDLRTSLGPQGAIGGMGRAGSGVSDALIGGLIGGLISGSGRPSGRTGSGSALGGAGRPGFGGSGGTRRSAAPRSSGRRGGGGRF